MKAISILAFLALLSFGCDTKNSAPCVDEQPLELARWDAFPGATVCGPVSIVGEVCDSPGGCVDGISRIWVMLDGDEVAESTFIDCPECVDISLLNFDINGTGTLAFFAEDCDGNASILKQVVITAAYDEDPPVVTWVSPTDGETIIGTSHIFEVSVTSDNDDLEVFTYCVSLSEH